MLMIRSGVRWLFVWWMIVCGSCCVLLEFGLMSGSLLLGVVWCCWFWFWMWWRRCVYWECWRVCRFFWWVWLLVWRDRVLRCVLFLLFVFVLLLLFWGECGWLLLLVCYWISWDSDGCWGFRWCCFYCDWWWLVWCSRGLWMKVMKCDSGVEDWWWLCLFLLGVKCEVLERREYFWCWMFMKCFWKVMFLIVLLICLLFVVVFLVGSMVFV